MTILALDRGRTFMCGIAGFWDLRKRLDHDSMRSRLLPMVQALQHRGPDDEGAWCDPNAGIALGHRRLSIIDLSPTGRQPMWSNDRRFCIVFNGEIYNFADLRRELEAGTAVAWRGSSDTEVLLAAISRWGVESALRRAVGMFAFAVWDAMDRTLTLARDRIGEKPLYYGWHDGTFVFASELKAIRACPGWSGRIDPSALASFLHYGYVPGPLSIYESIAKLPPAHWMRVGSDGQADPPTPYWSAAETTARSASPMHFDPTEASDELEELIRTSIAGQMVADVPVGAFLSGGIDSSLVVALMQKLSTRPVKTFTIGFREASFDEAPHAAAIARYLGTEHEELYVTPGDAMSVIPELARIYDEPFADDSQIPTVLLCRMTRRTVTVSLSGDGGDELFAGYGRYRSAEMLWRRMSRLPGGARKAVGSSLRGVGSERLGWFGKAMQPLLPRAWRGGNFADRFYKVADILGLPDLASVHQRMVAHWPRPEAVLKQPIASPRHFVDSFTRLDCGIAAMMAADLVTWLPDDVLAKLDRAAMSVSLESRIPLLDHRIVEFAWRLPLAAKLGSGQTKRLLRLVLARHVPASLVERPKKGFNLPVGEWLRGPLREWAEAQLGETRLRREGIFNLREVRTAWHEHLEGRRDLHVPLWNLLMFQAWNESFALPA